VSVSHGFNPNARQIRPTDDGEIPALAACDCVFQPLIVSKAVDISAFVAMVAVLVGAASAGVVGAVLVTPVQAFVTSLRRDFRT